MSKVKVTGSKVSKSLLSCSDYQKALHWRGSASWMRTRLLYPFRLQKDLPTYGLTDEQGRVIISANQIRKAVVLYHHHHYAPAPSRRGH